MKYLYCMRDTQVGHNYPPFVARNPAEAIRTFGDSLQAPNSLAAKHPTHFALVGVGSFDEETGVVTGLPQQTYCTGADFMQPEAVDANKDNN